VKILAKDTISDKPIRLLHGSADDWVPVAPFRRLTLPTPFSGATSGHISLQRGDLVTEDEAKASRAPTHMALLYS
jgi:hypothetical protein